MEQLKHVAKPFPYYPHYVYDFDESPRVLGMNLAEVGLYQLSLDEAWKRGSIPDNAGELAILIRKKPAEVRKAWPKVRECFHENGNPGRLVNERQEIERAKAQEKSRKATNAVLTRYASATPEATNVVSDVSSGVGTNEHIRTSDSGSSSFGNTKPSLRLEFQETFEAFMAACQKHGIAFADDEIPWFREIWKKLPMQKQLAAVAGISARIESGEYDDPRFRPLAINYLEKRIWERPIRSKNASTPADKPSLYREAADD